MTKPFFDWLCGLIAAGDIHPFYVSGEWRRLSAEILRDEHWDCQICKAGGVQRRAELVHHVRHVRKFPALALSRLYIDESGVQHRNLISVCRACHESVCHPERLRPNRPQRQVFDVEERWD